MNLALKSVRLQMLTVLLIGLAAEGHANPVQLTYRYACEAELVFEGPRQNDHMGAAMDSGQLTGDSNPEILVGTFNRWDPDIPPAIPNPLKHGYAYLLDGARLGWGSSTPSWPSVAIEGRTLDDRFGFAVEFVGDLNPAPMSGSLPGFHDPNGIVQEDFIVSNPRGGIQSGSWDNRGEVFVFLSTQFSPTFPQSPLQLASPFSAETSASLIIQGAIPDERFGYSVCGVGDWNADGYDDFVVGAPGGPGFETGPNESVEQNVRGRIYIVSGYKVQDRALAHFLNPTVAPKLVSVLDVAMLTVVGDSVGTELMDRFGFSLADLGTVAVEGVNTPSFAVGAPSVYPNVNNQDSREYASYGYVEVISRESIQVTAGQPATANVPNVVRYTISPAMPQPPLSTTIGIPPQITTWNGVEFGFAIGGAELDGSDGLELIIGAPRWDHQFLEEGVLQSVMDSGAAFVVDVVPATSASSHLMILDGVSPVLFTTYGVATSEEHGFSVGSTGLRWDATAIEPSYGVCSFRGWPSVNSNACPVNSSQHPNVPPVELKSGGGRLAGILHIYSGATGGLIGQIVGEDSRDSVGWDFIDAGNLGGDIQSDLILSSPRWGLQEQPGGQVGMEWGRVYYFETRSVQ